MKVGALAAAGLFLASFLPEPSATKNWWFEDLSWSWSMRAGSLLGIFLAICCVEWRKQSRQPLYQQVIDRTGAFLSEVYCAPYDCEFVQIRRWKSGAASSTLGPEGVYLLTPGYAVFELLNGLGRYDLKEKNEALLECGGEKYRVHWGWLAQGLDIAEAMKP